MDVVLTFLSLSFLSPFSLLYMISKFILDGKKKKKHLSGQKLLYYERVSSIANFLITLRKFIHYANLLDDTFESIEVFEAEATKFGKTFVSLAGIKKETVYLHMLTCHVGEMLKRHGALGKVTI